MTLHSTQNAPAPAAGNPFSLSGRAALVTGSSKGLGKAIAIGLGRAGAKVALNYFHDSAKADEAFAEFKESGGDGMLVRADVTDPTDVERMVAETARPSLPGKIFVSTVV